MLISHHTASVTRTVGRYVTCEKCGCQYTFTVTAKAEGKASGTLGAGIGRSEALEAASRNVNRKLLSEPAACPDCGWYQKPMVAELRRRHHRWMTILARGLLIFLAGSAAYLLLYGDGASGGGSRHRDGLIDDFMAGPFSATYEVVALVLGATAATLLLVRSRLASQYNPNRNYPQRPDSRPGEPPTSRTPEYQRLVELRTVNTAPGGLAGAKWYYSQDGSRPGPVSCAQLAEWLGAGAIEATHEVWCEGLSGWVPVGEVFGSDL